MPLSGFALKSGLVLAAVLLVALAAPAQVLISGQVSAPVAKPNPHLAEFSAGAKLGLALPSAPHLLVLWNMAGVSYNRWQGRAGVSLETGLEAWFSPTARPALSWGPVILGEAAVGRRWGVGLHGYTAVGAGVGWSFGSWVPYVEYRRRLGFHRGRQAEDEMTVGVHFILFG